MSTYQKLRLAQKEVGEMRRILERLAQEVDSQKRIGEGNGGEWEKGYASAWGDVVAILAQWVTVSCHCCGRNHPTPTARIDSGSIHPDCWDEHHSDPTTEWPPGHVCAREGR